MSLLLRPVIKLPQEMTDPLKFIKDVEAKAIGASRNITQRNLNALDEVRTENARLQRELNEAREENRKLRERIRQPKANPVVIPVQAPVIEAKSSQEEPLDDAVLRFRLLELK